MDEHFVDLKVDRSLLDPHFDGYKLSLDSFPQYKCSLSDSLDEAKLAESEYSYQHVKAFGGHNHLWADPFCSDTVYWADCKGNICGARYVPGDGVSSQEKVFSISDHAQHLSLPTRRSVSLKFASATLALLADGAGTLVLVHTGDRAVGTDLMPWREVYRSSPLEGLPFTVAAAVSPSPAHTDCVLLHVEDRETGWESGAAGEDGAQQQASSAFVTKLEWLSLQRTGDSNQWSETRHRRLVGGAAPDYVALETSGEALHVAAEKYFQFDFDSDRPVEEAPKKEEGEAEGGDAYTCVQTEDELTVTLQCPDASDPLDKTLVLWSLTPNDISVSYDGTCLLKGQLWGSVDTEACSWTLHDKSLEVLLTKRESGAMWPQLLTGEDKGHMEIAPETAERMKDQLQHLTSDTQAGGGGERPTFNSEQLEECDAPPGQEFTLARIDGTTHLPTHMVSLGAHQLLFCASVSGDSAGVPVMCLRHDVDGLVWQPCSPKDPALPPWQHTHTFNALGYVQASKQNRRFTLCSTDASFAVIVDGKRHAYIYRQPGEIATPIRNRKTGRTVSAVANQHLVTLEDNDLILGACVGSRHVFLATAHSLIAISVPCA